MTARDPTRRRRILDAARRHLTARGFRGLTLDAVAAEVGCAKGALYLEFADKEALLRAVVDETLPAVRDRYLAEVLAFPSPLARLGQSLRFAFREFTREPLFARLMFGAGTGNPYFTTDWQGRFGRLKSTLMPY